MRNFGAILMLAGILGFYYSTTRLERERPLPEGLTVSEGLEYPAGRWEMARYGAGGAAALGLLLALLPKGR